MADRMAFLLFGGQAAETHGFLAGLCREGNLSILSKAFLERASNALRQEVDGLGKLEKAHIPTFRTLYQLNDKYHSQKLKHAGIDAALLCMTQLAHYIE